MNTITVVGRLTAEPKFLCTSDGTARATFGLAVNRRRKNASGQWEDEPSFFDVIAWRELADNVAETLAKGDRVIVAGRLGERSWEQDGNQRKAVEIVAEEIGPSLRFASCEINRVERRQENG